MSVNSQCEFYFSLVSLLEEFFNQEGAKGCCDSRTLSTKMKEMICEHAIDTNFSNDFNGVLGAAFIKSRSFFFF